MSTRFGPFAAALAFAGFAGVAACVPEGAEGGPCKWTGGIFNGGWICDEGLVCYSPREPETCEKPNLHGAGEACVADWHCFVELWCPPGTDPVCTARIEEGGWCPAGVGCAAGLQCVKEDESHVCRPAT